MKNIAVIAILASAAGIFHAQNTLASAGTAAPGRDHSAAGLRAKGEGTLRFLGLPIYRARLWVAPQFDARDYAAHPLALELTYERGFSAAAIAQRSLAEMRRIAPVSEAQAARWQQALQAALPDVQQGDRLTGRYQPGQGVRFELHGRSTGAVDDADFARLFFGIWLAPQTSEPGLRAQLLGERQAGAAP